MTIFIRLGRPTHLQAGRSTACGRPNVVFITTDRSQVDCVACRRTKEFRIEGRTMQYPDEPKDCPRYRYRFDGNIWTDPRGNTFTPRDMQQLIPECTCGSPRHRAHRSESK